MSLSGMLDQPSWMTSCHSYMIQDKQSERVIDDLGSFDTFEEADDLRERLPNGDDLEVVCIGDFEPDMGY